jgi:hypothetical protein
MHVYTAAVHGRSALRQQLLCCVSVAGRVVSGVPRWGSAAPTWGSLMTPGCLLYQSLTRPTLGWMTLTPACAAATPCTMLHRNTTTSQQAQAAGQQAAGAVRAADASHSLRRGQWGATVGMCCGMGAVSRERSRAGGQRRELSGASASERSQAAGAAICKSTGSRCSSPLKHV